MTLPFAVSIYWDLPVLLVVVSIVYSATRYDHWKDILHEAWRWGSRMVGFLGMIAIVLYVVHSLL
jgi:hypothetical protein